VSVPAEHWREARNLRLAARLRSADPQPEARGLAREGVLRRHMRVKGYQRDTVYFSILDTEWPSVRSRLAARLDA